MKIVFIILSIYSLTFFSGCGGASTTTEPPEANVSIDNNLPLPTIHSLRIQIAPGNYTAIKPLQVITNKNDLDMLYDISQSRYKFDEEEIDFTKDVVVAIKHSSFFGYSGMGIDPASLFGYSGMHLDPDSIRIISDSDEISGQTQEENASIEIGLIKNAFNKPIYLTKRTTIKEPRKYDNIKNVVTYSGSLWTHEEDVSYLTSESNLSRIAPLVLTNQAELMNYAATYGFDISNLAFDGERFEHFENHNIITSGFLASDTEVSYDVPVISGGSMDGLILANEDGSYEEISNNNYFVLINGLRYDCNESYPHKKEVAFNKINDVDESLLYITAEQTIEVKSCANIRTADLDEIGAWLSR